MKKVLITFQLLMMVSLSFGQNQKDRDYIIQQTNVKELKKFAEERTKHYKTNLAIFNASNKSKRIDLGNNQIAVLTNFDPNGNPVYQVNDNYAAAVTSRVDKIWNGGESGLNLDGTGIVIGHWEPLGIALPIHVEMTGRIENVENTISESHASHTAGTMIASGVLPEARGMASNAKIKAFLGDNDESEMADFAADGGILSNHSYGHRLPEENTHIYYGVYGFLADYWDYISYNAPYLTIVKSAGNTRNNGINVKDNGYDVLKTVSNCKNLLVVGAIEDMPSYFGSSSVVQSSFSSWGPTDDWRIKPDIVTNGVGVLSTDNLATDDYSIKSGTSMAAPAATGAIALLQQHYHQLNNVYMKSATVKALLTGTTDEAGFFDGPDFQNGWGVLNAERAANVITNNGGRTLIKELSLIQNTTYRMEFEVSENSNVIASIAWTDKEGGETPLSEDANVGKLINDIDLRIYGNGVEYKPWVLEPNANYDNFSAPAVKGDNYRDNVERIDLKDLPAGTYSLEVTNKPKLYSGKQDFSLVLQGIANNTLNVTDNILSDATVKVYPNPSTEGNLNVSINNNNSTEDYRITIYDMLGKQVITDKFDSNQFTITLPSLTSGIYILKIQSGPYNYQKMVHLSNK